jgi:hypothetical protein
VNVKDAIIVLPDKCGKRRESRRNLQKPIRGPDLFGWREIQIGKQTVCTARPVDPPERRRPSMQSGENVCNLLAWRRFEWYMLFPDPATRPRQQEVLIEFLRKGEVDEAVRAFKKPYLEVVHQMIEHLETEESGSASH